MSLILARLLLLAGVILLQIVPMGGGSVSDQLIQFLSQAPTWVLLAVILFRVLAAQGDMQKSNERSDERHYNHVTKLTEELSADRRRIDDIEEDRKRVEEERRVSMNTLATSIENQTLMTKALEERTTYLLTSDQEGAKILQSVNVTMKQVYDKLLLVFPTEKPMDARLDELKKDMIEAVERICEEKKHHTGELAVITPSQINVTPAQPEANPT